VEHEIEVAGYVDYFIEEQVIRSHCVAMSFGYEDFKKQLEQIDGYTVSYMRKDMMARTRGPQMRIRAMCIRRRVERDAPVEDA
jgi:hypothetical protein